MTSRQQLIDVATRAFNKSRAHLATPPEALEDVLHHLLKTGWLRLGTIAVRSERADLTWAYQILDEVCRNRRVTPAALMGKRVPNALAWTRDEAAFVMRHRGEISWPQLGAIFGKHHSTLIAGKQKFIQRMRRDDIFRARVEANLDGKTKRRRRPAPHPRREAA